MLNLWFKYSTVKKPLRSQWDFWLSLALALAGVLTVPGIMQSNVVLSAGWNNPVLLVLLAIVNLLVLACLVITGRDKQSTVEQGEFYICIAFNCAVLLLFTLAGMAIQLPLLGLAMRMAQRKQFFESSVFILVPLVAMLAGTIYGTILTLRLVVSFCSSLFSSLPTQHSGSSDTSH